MSLQAGKDVRDVFDSEHEATYAEGVRRCVPLQVLTTVGVWNFVSSSRPWPSGVRTHRDVDSDIVEPDAVHPSSLDYGLAFQVQTDRNSTATPSCDTGARDR